MMAVIDTLPFSKVVMLIYCAFSTIFLATTVNSGCYVVAATATRRMPVDADPTATTARSGPWRRLLALGLLAMGGLEVAKIFGNFSGALMALPSLLLTACWLKIIREDGKDLLHTYRAKD
ncbi:MAG: BCCT family transporter [Bilophila wadsworthia]